MPPNPETFDLSGQQRLLLNEKLGVAFNQSHNDRESTKEHRSECFDLSFYRRQMPQQCIDFSSKEGKSIFKEAIVGDYMNSFFKLMPQFRTQQEPGSCGLGTLIVILNALGADPGEVWKSPWRWYEDEAILKCCVPMETVKSVGIDVVEFVCTAKRNGLRVETHYADDECADENAFRNAVKFAAASDSVVLACNFHRGTLGQTGTGHFSPVGGYNENCDMLLILDVARFKYNPHWVKLTLLWQALQQIDPETGRSRAYFLISLSGNNEKILMKG